jgi:Multisubunit Na+/H+ antiporter, MnhE subunit
METKTKSRIIVFVAALLVWFALTDIKNYQEVLIGIAISLLVTFLTGHFLVTTEKTQHPLKRTVHFLFYILKFVWEMIKANLEVAYLVIHPMLPIKPGIVKIKTKLTKDSAITRSFKFNHSYSWHINSRFEQGQTGTLHSLDKCENAGCG